MTDRVIDSPAVLKPQPKPSSLSKRFWDAANADQLVIQKCGSPKCGKYVFYPRVCCPHCHDDSLAWVEVSGEGTIISNTTVHRTHHDGFNTEAPYVFAAVKLNEGACLYGQVRDAPADQALIGKQVVVSFETHGPSQKIVVFRLRDSNVKK